ncbi:hypothetical protein PR048_029950 [Dryococelus australis]|uniref:Receptor-type tyrosine-protein phosphatase N2 n=1 Tax=Dryococelus australis TaxID=614101 RepID=A0ABQ9G7L2_9NEOP|nr:hypothetical protein PR048_029950 [Dryococelus australis]
MLVEYVMLHWNVCCPPAERCVTSTTFLDDVDGLEDSPEDCTVHWGNTNQSINNGSHASLVISERSGVLVLPVGVKVQLRISTGEVVIQISLGSDASDYFNMVERLERGIFNLMGVLLKAGSHHRSKHHEDIELPGRDGCQAMRALSVAVLLMGLVVDLVGIVWMGGQITTCFGRGGVVGGVRCQSHWLCWQELCRARMATKAQHEKPEPLHMGQRIASLSRESEGSNNSHSSRSSTSSWSEEPALTNMDISTGHMVLSYMEDHLKNKFRLEQEWVGLCAYEAEPCAVTISHKEENVKKNRYPDVLPYDHARVVLNDLTNISGSDYINASTITDHDPRNPAYIATQGPLPHTAPDFWQMVWEQGSVVMVMLTRLTENGAAMCHRYWPEEGSELYHIYEVHLVSEHIWCDDYLVRSFYLKNLKTGETRTVTQFHFLSWPEGGIPLSMKALLEFRRKVNKSYRGRSCPIVVHCSPEGTVGDYHQKGSSVEIAITSSDGAGRTGTYCLIDMVLNRMAKGAKEIDIAATLEHIRDQRPNMVRSKQQFEFVLMAIAEEVNAILKALPPIQPQQPPVPHQHDQPQPQQQQQEETKTQ